MPISRKKSCQQCRVAKTRCTLERICQRCMERGLNCEYATGTARWGPYGSMGTAGTGLDALWTTDTSAMQVPFAPLTDGSDSLVTGFESGDFRGPFGLFEPDLTEQGAVDVMRQSGPALEFIGGLRSLGVGQQEQQPERNREAAVMPLAADEVHHVLPWMTSSPFLYDTTVGMDMSSLIRQSSPTSSGKGIATPEHRIPTETSGQISSYTVIYGRRHEQFLRVRKEANLERSLMLRVLVGQIEDYPRRLAEGSRLPPFIHPRCVLEDRLPHQCISIDGTHRCLPEPLAICASLTQLYFSRSKGSSQYVWKLIYAEMRRMHTEHRQYDCSTLLASVQAMCLFMLLQAKDQESIAQNDVGGLTVMLAEMSKTLHGHPDGSPYMSDIYQQPNLNRKTWALYESIRRVTNLFRVVGVVLNVIIGNPNLPDCGTMLAIPMLCNGYLWETDTAESWAARLHRYKSRRACSERILLLGDLGGTGKENSSVGNTGGVGTDPLSSKDLLSDPLLQKDLATWCEDLDELGTLVWLASRLDREASTC